MTYNNKCYESSESHESCYDSCSYDSYNSCSDKHKHKHGKKHKKHHYYCPPPSCPKPAFGKCLAAKLCADKVIPANSCGCACGYANFKLSNNNKCVKWCVKVFNIDVEDHCKCPCIDGSIHKAGPCEENTPDNLVKDIKLKGYPLPPSRGSYGDCCKCQYVFVGKGKWCCNDCDQKLTGNLIDSLVCGLLNIQVGDEARGQICDYEDIHC